MTNDLEELAAAIRRVLPASQIEPAADELLDSIRQEFPDVPVHYIEFLKRIGWGSLGDCGFMIYGGLIGPSDIFDEATALELTGIVFLGDDFAGWVVGFDTRAGWRLVGFENCGSPEPLPHRTLAEFIAERLADAAGPDGSSDDCD